MPTQLPRLNVTVTREQHALLLELASLDPDTPSAASFIRQLLDQATPLLRTTVPLMRAAKEAHGGAKETMREELRRFMAEMQQMDLLDPPAGSGAPAPQRSEERRASTRGRRKS
jgi:hypothetical protein